MNLIVDNLHISGFDSGSGKTALLLHGWGNDSRGFKLLSQGLEGYRVIAPDLPGFGASQPPAKAWGVEEYAAFVVKMLGKLEIKEIDLLVGHSFGGRIALVLAGDKYIPINKLVLLASHGLPEAKTAKTTGIGLLAKTAKLLPAFVRRPVGERLGSPDYKAATGIMRDVFKRVITQDAAQQARDITCPTLLIYGQEDPITPPELGRRFNQLISGSSLELVEGAGHHLHQERPGEILRLLKEFNG